jgi:hypothetical protein
VRRPFAPQTIGAAVLWASLAEARGARMILAEIIGRASGVGLAVFMRVLKGR